MPVKHSLKTTITTNAKELLQHKTLDKLTVSEISKSCAMTRQIFYHYFTDKYDLVKMIYQQDYLSVVQTMHGQVHFLDLLYQLFLLIQEHSAFYKNTLFSMETSTRCNPMKEHLSVILSSLVTNQHQSQLPPEIHSDLSFTIEFYCSGIISCIKSNLIQKDNRDLTSLISEIGSCSPALLHPFIYEHTISTEQLACIKLKSDSDN